MLWTYYHDFIYQEGWLNFLHFTEVFIALLNSESNKSEYIDYARSGKIYSNIFSKKNQINFYQEIYFLYLKKNINSKLSWRKFVWRFPPAGSVWIYSENEINQLEGQAKSKREMLLKLQGIIEYLQQTGVELPKEEEGETPVVTPEAEVSDK